jgi:hypothetical protein
MYLRNCQYTSSQQVINKIMFLQFLCIVILSEMRIQVWLLLLWVFNAILKVWRFAKFSNVYDRLFQQRQLRISDAYTAGNRHKQNSWFCENLTCIFV